MSDPSGAGGGPPDRWRDTLAGVAIALTNTTSYQYLALQTALVLVTGLSEGTLAVVSKVGLIFGLLLILPLGAVADRRALAAWALVPCLGSLPLLALPGAPHVVLTALVVTSATSCSAMLLLNSVLGRARSEHEAIQASARVTAVWIVVVGVLFFVEPVAAMAIGAEWVVVAHAVLTLVAVVLAWDALADGPRPRTRLRATVWTDQVSVLREPQVRALGAAWALSGALVTILEIAAFIEALKIGSELAAGAVSAATIVIGGLAIGLVERRAAGRPAWALLLAAELSLLGIATGLAGAGLPGLAWIASFVAAALLLEIGSSLVSGVIPGMVADARDKRSDARAAVLMNLRFGGQLIGAAAMVGYTLTGWVDMMLLAGVVAAGLIWLLVAARCLVYNGHIHAGESRPIAHRTLVVSAEMASTIGPDQLEAHGAGGRILLRVYNMPRQRSRQADVEEWYDALDVDLPHADGALRVTSDGRPAFAWRLDERTIEVRFVDGDELVTLAVRRRQENDLVRSALGDVAAEPLLARLRPKPAGGIAAWQLATIDGCVAAALAAFAFATGSAVVSALAVAAAAAASALLASGRPGRARWWAAAVALATLAAALTTGAGVDPTGTVVHWFDRGGALALFAVLAYAARAAARAIRLAAAPRPASAR